MLGNANITSKKITAFFETAPKNETDALLRLERLNSVGSCLNHKCCASPTMMIFSRMISKSTSPMMKAAKSDKSVALGQVSAVLRCMPPSLHGALCSSETFVPSNEQNFGLDESYSSDQQRGRLSKTSTHSLEKSESRLTTGDTGERTAQLAIKESFTALVLDKGIALRFTPPTNAIQSSEDLR